MAMVLWANWWPSAARKASPNFCWKPKPPTPARSGGRKEGFSSVSWSPVFRNATEASSEQLLARSVKFAAAELKKFAERNGYDLRHSGVENPNPNQLLWYFGGIKIEEL